MDTLLVILLILAYHCVHTRYQHSREDQEKILEELDKKLHPLKHEID
jgi:hypothetical protein